MFCKYINFFCNGQGRVILLQHTLGLKARMHTELTKFTEPNSLFMDQHIAK